MLRKDVGGEVPFTKKKKIFFKINIDVKVLT